MDSFPTFANFSVYIPSLAYLIHGKMQGMNTNETTPTNQVRILVVDDHPNTANTLARALAQLGPGVDVTSATSGRDALDKVQDKGVDILFTDMIMPEMTGLELIEKLQHNPGGRPSFTYLVTAYEIPGLKISAQRLKVNDVIVKPVKPERICQIAAQAMLELNQAIQPEKTVKETRNKFKILVADDSPDNVTLLLRYLQSEGYDQVIAKDGEEALEKVRSELPDLVMLDVNMPLKDGFTVLQEIRKDPVISHIPVIILTAARLNPSDVQSGLNLGADDYVTKPFDRHELMARIRTKLRVKGAEDVIRQRNKQLDLLPEIGMVLNAYLSLPELIDSIIRQTVTNLGAMSGHFILRSSEVSPHEYQITTFESSGPQIQLPPLDDFLDYIGRTRQGLIIDDTSHDLRWSKTADSTACSAIMVPLYGRDDLVGALMLIHNQPGYFNLEHQRLLQAIANQAAIAVENIQLYEQIKALSSVGTK